MMETMRETPHGNSISTFSTSPLPSQTRLEQRAQVRKHVKTTIHNIASNFINKAKELVIYTFIINNYRSARQIEITISL